MKYIIIFIIFINLLFSNSDYFYNYVDENGKQLSYKKAKSLESGYQTLQRVKELMRFGKIDEAFDMINVFLFTTNKNKELESDAILLYAELSLKKKMKRFVIKGAKVLEKAINSSKIHEIDLDKAYKILVDLKLAQNRVDEAEYFAKTIIETFDDEIKKTYGKIYLARVYTYKKEYKKAIKILYKILVETSDLQIATIVADDLFNVYIADKQKEKAYKLMKQVLTTNMKYYTDDTYRALKAINRLVKAGMNDFAERILKALIKESTSDESLEDFKYRLANLYMDMYSLDHPEYLVKAQKIYEDILSKYPNGIHAKKVKMYIDEILMRQKKIEPIAIVQRYKKSESMKQKALFQEILNYIDHKKYDYLIKNWSAYKDISPSIAKRFGFKSMYDVYDYINNLAIKQLLVDGNCSELHKALKTARKETLLKLIKDDKMKYDFFECLIDYPYERAYELIKNVFKYTKDGNIYIYLERMAYALGKYKEAYDFSINIDIADDKKIFEREFLYRFLTYQAQDSDVIKNKFFYYAYRHPEYIKANENNPLILDFYYNFYFYLLGLNKKELALAILNRLYERQNFFKAYVYSPFVDFEFVNMAKDKKDYKKAIEYLVKLLEHKKNIIQTDLQGKDVYRLKPDELAHVYYELADLYKKEKDSFNYDKYLKKCKNIKTKDSIYKKMCERL